MRVFFKLMALLLLASNVFNAPEGKKGFPELSGPYLGQKLPGPDPEIFAPGIISFGYHEHRLAISADGMEMYFSLFTMDPFRAMIMCTQIKNGLWTAPAVASFSDSGMNLHPAFSPDGKRIYFASTRPLVGGGERDRGADIWFVERRGDAWSEPVNMGGSINTAHNESSPFLAADGTLFFESNRNPNKGDWDIYISHLTNGVYQKAEKLPFPVNTENEEGGPCISPDGSCLLFYSNRPGTFGEADIYVAFKKKDGTWNEPKNLGGKINSKFYDWAPMITPDGKCIIFSSQRNTGPIKADYGSYRETLQKELGQPKTGLGTFYWTDAKIIDELKEER